MKRCTCLSLACLCAMFLFLSRPSMAQSSYGAPAGGWLYVYEAKAGEDVAGAAGSGFTSLDGTWSHDNGSDEWDGSALGGAGSPGGANIVDGFLRIQETGDPRDHAFPDPGSNRKIFLGHDLSADGASGTLLDDGVTLYFRARVSPTGDDLHPDGGGAITPYPALGDGYLTHDGGKANIGLKQASGGLISIALATGFDTGPLGPGIVANNLNGTTITGDVDFGEAGDPRALGLDTTQFHEFWFTIEGVAGGAGTHRLRLWLDGGLDPAADVELTAGSGSDFSDITYLALGVGSTGQSGGLDVDYVRVAAGVHAPTELVLPEVPIASVWGTSLTVLLLMIAGALLLRRQRPAARSV